MLRQGVSAWLVSSGGRVLGALAIRPYPPLPRIWVPGSVNLSVGETLPAGDDHRGLGREPREHLHRDAVVVARLDRHLAGATVDDGEHEAPFLLGDEGLGGQQQGFSLPLHRELDPHVHAGPQGMVGVRQVDLDGHGPGGVVEGVGNPRHPPSEAPSRQLGRAHLHRQALADGGHLGLGDGHVDPDSAEIHQGEDAARLRCAARGGGGDEGADVDPPPGHHPGERRGEAGVAEQRLERRLGEQLAGLVGVTVHDLQPQLGPGARVV